MGIKYFPKLIKDVSPRVSFDDERLQNKNFFFLFVKLRSKPIECPALVPSINVFVDCDIGARRF
jgi:hypothetical protein